MVKDNHFTAPYQNFRHVLTEDLNHLAECQHLRVHRQLHQVKIILLDGRHKNVFSEQKIAAIIRMAKMNMELGTVS